MRLKIEGIIPSVFSELSMNTFAKQFLKTNQIKYEYRNKQN